MWCSHMWWAHDKITNWKITRPYNKRERYEMISWGFASLRKLHWINLALRRRRTSYTRKKQRAAVALNVAQRKEVGEAKKKSKKKKPKRKRRWKYVNSFQYIVTGPCSRLRKLALARFRVAEKILQAPRTLAQQREHGKKKDYSLLPYFIKIFYCLSSVLYGAAGFRPSVTENNLKRDSELKNLNRPLGENSKVVYCGWRSVRYEHKLG